MIHNKQMEKEIQHNNQRNMYMIPHFLLNPLVNQLDYKIEIKDKELKWIILEVSIFVVFAIEPIDLNEFFCHKIRKNSPILKIIIINVGII